MKAITRKLTIGAAALAAFLLFSAGAHEAQAQFGGRGIGLHIGGRNAHIDIGNPHGYGYARGYGYGGATYGGGRGYYSQRSYYGGFGRSRAHYDYHETSHYDYHPGGYVPHRGHYDYQPGHYDFHQQGHYDLHRGGHYGRHH